MTTDSNNIENVEKVENDESQKAWDALWEFANNEISWTEHRIDRESFIEIGKGLFEIKIKD